jgi:hypothetical protein
MSAIATDDKNLYFWDTYLFGRVNLTAVKIRKSPPVEREPSLKQIKKAQDLKGLSMRLDFLPLGFSSKQPTQSSDIL